MGTIISIQNVSKAFKTNQVLKNISVDFQSGLIYGIVGRNGSGKSVLIKTICGFIRPDTGNVFVSDKHIGKDVDFPEKIGVIIEAPGFLPNRSAFSNLMYLASLRNKIGKDEVCKAMQIVGLNPDDKKHVGKFSMGMKQRLGIAQAIMEDPDILILDEPMNGLDKEGVKEIRKLLLNLKESKKTILLVSHSAEDIEILCDVVFEMDAGNLVAMEK